MRVSQVRRLRRWLKRSPILAASLLIALVTILFTAIALIAGPVVAERASLSEDDWSRLTALSSLLGLGFALGAGVAVLLEISDATDSRNLGLYQDIYEKFMSDEAIGVRRRLYNLPDIPAGAGREAAIEAVLADQPSRDAVKYTLNQIDYFGFLVERDWVTSDEIVGWLSPVVVKIWAKIGPIVAYECARRPEEPDYYSAAIHLAAECERWRDKRHPGWRQITFDRRRL